jgi:hypothetical protein
MSYRPSTTATPHHDRHITAAHAIDGLQQMVLGLGYALAGMVLGVAMSLLIHQI